MYNMQRWICWRNGGRSKRRGAKRRVKGRKWHVTIIPTTRGKERRAGTSLAFLAATSWIIARSCAIIIDIWTRLIVRITIRGSGTKFEFCRYYELSTGSVGRPRRSKYYEPVQLVIWRSRRWSNKSCWSL